MDNNLNQIKEHVYDKCGLEILDLIVEPESKEYDACQFTISGLKVISRSAKVTPKKVGQFVTFWKRVANGPIEPYNETDHIDFFIVNVRTEKQFGQFVFPKAVLINKGIISTSKKDGKRGFRVYANWDLAINKQAERTQKWQQDYFYEISNSMDLDSITELYKAK